MATFEVEDLWCEVVVNEKFKYQSSTIYNHPNGNINDVLEKLNCVLSKISDDHTYE